MTDLKDSATSAVKVATDILFVRNPVGTSMGTVFGVVLHGLVQLFAPFLNTLELVKASALSIFHFIALGVFGFNVNHMRTYHKVRPEIEEAIQFIESQQDKGNITKLEAKQKYRELIAKAIDNVQLDERAKKAINIAKEMDSDA